MADSINFLDYDTVYTETHPDPLESKTLYVLDAVDHRYHYRQPNNGGWLAVYRQDDDNLYHAAGWETKAQPWNGVYATVKVSDIWSRFETPHPIEYTITAAMTLPTRSRPIVHFNRKMQTSFSATMTIFKGRLHRLLDVYSQVYNVILDDPNFADDGGQLSCYMFALGGECKYQLGNITNPNAIATRQIMSRLEK